MTSIEESPNLPLKEIYFTNKTIVITGGASGIGLSFAQELSKFGAKVKILDINKPTETDENIEFSQVDVSNRESFAGVGHLKPDILIIAAGVTSATDEPTQQEMLQMDQVNVDGVENTLQVFQPLLKDGVQVVYIGTDDPPKQYYKETKEKGAEIVQQFSELNPNIDVRLLRVGPVNTDLFKEGKKPSQIEIISQKVGLFEPSEFAEEVINDLIVESRGLTQKRMYQAVGN